MKPKDTLSDRLKYVEIKGDGTTHMKGYLVKDVKEKLKDAVDYINAMLILDNSQKWAVCRVLEKHFGKEMLE